MIFHQEQRLLFLNCLGRSMTIDCFFDDQDTTSFPKKMAYSLVDVLSLVLSAKLASASAYNIGSFPPRIRDLSYVL